MADHSIHNNETQTLEIPPLEIKPIRHALGYISHVIDAGGRKEIVSVEDISISPRRKGKINRLSDNQTILVVPKKMNIDRPKDVDGILLVDETGKNRWLSHKKLDDFNNDIDSLGLDVVAKNISDSWPGKFSFHSEERDASGEVIAKGLRPPQIGALHSIGAHWSQYQQPATIVMPTGTGKTETMLATLVAYSPRPLLVVVPSRVLRDQTATKFLTLGLLRSLSNLSDGAVNPIVGVIRKRPKSESNLDIFEKSNVVIGTMAALSDESTLPLAAKIAERVKTLIVDEAHHIGASGWATFREQFTSSKVLQFTATPYRRDGKLIDGKVIYDYPLRSAQEDGYFRAINFEPVYEIDPDNIDKVIAVAAIERLKSDINAGRDHILMARCANIEKAKHVHSIYKSLAPEFNALLVHSKQSDAEESLGQVNTRNSRIVVCVNMLGEGYDLPQLKIAAVHDAHKSLAILLQFTGRFTRTSQNNIGDATVIANIADQDVSSALERLYSEDADWNYLLSEFSSEAAKAHKQLIEFLNSSESFGGEDEEKIEISHQLLRPTFNTLIYEADSFAPKKFTDGIPRGTDVHQVWLHPESNTLYFVTRQEPGIKWTRSRQIKDRVWDIYIFHYDTKQKLLYVSSSDKSSAHERIATAVGATKMISGDVIFRALGNINRLIFQNVGVKKHGRRNLRYAMYTGADVAEALSISERAGSVKSNLSGTGWENGRPTTIGCSYKGRVWTREPGTIPELVNWCELVGQKIKDESINTTEIIKNVLIPEEVDALPDKTVLSIEWPVEILQQSEERITLKRGELESPISVFDIVFTGLDTSKSQVDFRLVSASEEVWGDYILSVGGTDGFKVTGSTEDLVQIKIGSLEMPITDYLSNYPPMIRFIDLSELDGNLLIRPQSTQELVFPDENFEVWNWDGIDIKKESIWKSGSKREDSIQWHAAQQFIEGGFETIFDDDGAGEAADLVCFKEEDECIRLALVHCKFSKGATAGERVQDVVEVASQAVRSSKWKWKFKDLCRHILNRERRLSDEQRGSRFMVGQPSDMNKFVRLSRFKEIKAEIVIVQPGLSKDSHTPDQVAVLAAAHSFLKETIGVDLDVICSS